MLPIQEGVSRQGGKPLGFGGYSKGACPLVSSINPRLARENGVKGTVYLRFIVEADGQLTHHEVVRDVGAGLGQESLRVVKLFHNFKPSKANGNPMGSQFYLPVKFRLA